MEPRGRSAFCAVGSSCLAIWQRLKWHRNDQDNGRVSGVRIVEFACAGCAMCCVAHKREDRNVTGSGCRSLRRDFLSGRRFGFYEALIIVAK